MAIEYNKTTWLNDNTPLNADNMNHIEDGIEAATNAINDSVTNITAGLYMKVEKNGQTYLVKVDDTALSLDYIKLDKTKALAIPQNNSGALTWLPTSISPTQYSIVQRDSNGDSSFRVVGIDALANKNDRTADRVSLIELRRACNRIDAEFSITETTTNTGTVDVDTITILQYYPQLHIKYNNQIYYRMDPLNAPDGTLNYIHLDSIEDGNGGYKATGKCFSITVSTRAWQVVDLDFGGSTRTTHNLTLTNSSTGMSIYFSLTNNRPETYEGAPAGLLSALENSQIACTVDANGTYSAGMITTDGTNFKATYGNGEEALIEQMQVSITDNLA